MVVRDVRLVKLSAEELENMTFGVNPFARGDWNGRFISLDGTPAVDFTIDDVQTIIASGQEGDEWDGTVAGVLQLNDGTYVTYETFYGPTGHGFSEDAYGGDADICFASSHKTAVTMGLTDEGRLMCGITL